jgi:hypothetical protein
MLENIPLDVNSRLKRDLAYIKSDLIAKQLQKDIKDNEAEEEDEKEKYVKFSRLLGAVTIMNLTKKQYKKYWESQYKGYPEKNEIIMKAVEEKFQNGLIPREDMINMIKKSKDFESEKKRAIKLLSERKESR